MVIDKDEDLIKEALERFEYASDAWERIHNQYNEDVRFCNGEQWEDRILKIRNQEDRSVLTYNKLIANIKYIVNNARMNMPSLTCSPYTEGADQNTAKIFDGLIKYILYNSNAKTVFANSLKQEVMGGLGAFRVVIEPDMDGEPDFYVRGIKDPTTVYIDPDAERFCFEDMKYAFIISWMLKKDFEKKYPEASTSPIDPKSNWFQKDKVQIAEYWYREDGKVKMVLMSANEILERLEDYQPRFIPIVLIVGEEFVIDDIKEYKGITRDTKDIQRLLNYSKSETADYLARSAKQQWLISDKQMGVYQDKWNSANIQQFNYLPYEDSGTGAPTQIQPQVPPTALIQAAQDADNDMRAAIGIRDPLQDIPASQSGKAINLQISEGNIGIYNYYDSLKDGILMLGKILVDAIPYYYDEPKIAQIMGDDGQITPAKINQPYLENGQWVSHDLANGKYSVRLSTGPTYESQRAETAERLTDLVQKYPQMMQLAGDLIVKNLNFVGADELAMRLRASIPPQILAASNPSNADQAPMQLAASQNQMQQMQQQMQQMQAENQALKQEQLTRLQAEQAKHQMEMEAMAAKFKYDMALRQLDHKDDQELDLVKSQDKFALETALRAVDSEEDQKLELAKMQHDIVKDHINNQTKIFEKQLDHEHDLRKNGLDVTILP